MDKRWLAAAALVAGVGVVGYALFSRRTPEEQVREKLEQLATAIHVGEEPENPVVRATRLNGEFAEIFDKDVHATIPEISSPINDRRELVQLAARANVWVRTLDVDFSRLDVEAGEMAANASGPARISGVRIDGSAENGTRRVDFRFSKSGSDWKIASVRVEPEAEE